MRKERKVVSIVLFFLTIILVGAILKLYISYTKSSIKIQAEENKKEVKVKEIAAKYKNNSSIDKEYFDRLVDLCNKDERAIPILENYEKYPPALIKLACVNNEAIQYVVDYIDNKNKIRKDNIELKDDFQMEHVPLYIQWDERWGYDEYAGGLVGYTACGPTCLSMVYTYFTKDLSYNPGKMAEFSTKEGFVENGVGTKWSFMTEGAKKLGLNAFEISINESKIEKYLSSGKLIICSMKPGDFTDGGHFIVIVKYENGQVTVNDPNSRKNSNKLWNYKDICGQIKNIWVFEKK